jgi:hypothetical protein
MKRIHIVALSPRSGTTLLAECMALCLNIDKADEHEAPVWRLKTGGGIYLTKRPADLFAVWPRLLLDRHFYVICMVRDPRDVIVSRHGKDRKRYWVPLRMWKERLPDWQKLRAHPRFVTVRYEDLVSDADAIQRQICEQLPFLTSKHPFSAFGSLAAPPRDSVDALGGVRDIDRSSIGKWRNHLPRVAGQLKRHGAITEALVTFGYERDASWLTCLEGVAPDFTPSHLWERQPRSFRRRRHFAQVCVSAALVVAGRSIGIRVV